MKKVFLSLLTSVLVLNSSCQKHMLDYFPEILNDSIVHSTLLQNIYYANSKGKNIPDAFALKYVFDGDTKKMMGKEEGYNVDDNTYHNTEFVKKVCPLFKKKLNNNYLVCYGISSVIYISCFDISTDKILSSVVLADFSDDMGNIVTHSILFPSNYITQTRISEKVLYVLYKIDPSGKNIIQLKKLETLLNSDSQEEIFNRSLPTLGINEKGIPTN